MAITDTIFLFLFLPTTLLIYYIAKEELRKYILLFASLLFYACGSPDYFILLIVSLVVNIGITNIMVRISEAIQLKKILLTIGILYNVGILFYYKYFDFIGTNISRILNREYTVRGLALPLGLSFFTFKAISYLVDSYQGKIKKPDHILNAALYLSFFHRSSQDHWQDISIWNLVQKENSQITWTTLWKESIVL